MDGYTVDDLVNHPDDILAAADEAVVEITKGEAHKYVVMSREQFDRLRGNTRRAYHISELPDEFIDEMIRQMTAYVEDPSNPP